MDQNRIRELLSQARGEKPIEADPTTGFHPDQLTGYPLQRVGSRLYVATIEGVALADNPKDKILIEASEMDEYSAFKDPSPEEFEDVYARFSIRDERKPTKGANSLTQQGEALVSYTDIGEYLSEKDLEYEPEEYPNTLFEVGRERQTEVSVSDWQKLLDNSFTTLEMLH